MTFGRLLRMLRTKKGVSIKKLGPELDLSYTYISKLENSKVIPSHEVVKKLSKYFDYNSDELLLAAGKIPEDIRIILEKNPKEAVEYLRREFASTKRK